jgi:purine-binding chemotaxis protein CheW
MAAKKKGTKGARVKDKSASEPPKITLPAFGLAEDILGTQAGNADPGRVKGKPAPIAGVKPEAPAENPADLTIQDAGPTLHLVTFSLDGEEYGVDIASVHEIIRVSQITAVPNAPDFVRGVINLRGRVIPVLNLRKRLDLADEVLTKNSRIMIVECGTKVLGMLVDSVAQVIRIPAASVDAPPGEVEGTKAFVKGIGKIDSRLIMIMELDKVLSKEARQPVG